MKRLCRLIIAAAVLMCLPIMDSRAADSVSIVSDSIDNSSAGGLRVPRLCTRRKRHNGLPPAF